MDKNCTSHGSTARNLAPECSARETKQSSCRQVATTRPTISSTHIYLKNYSITSDSEESEVLLRRGPADEHGRVALVEKQSGRAQNFRAPPHGRHVSMSD